MIEPGLYRHYKGNLYEVICLAHHSETLEEMIVYKALYKTQFGENSMWVRPAKMFEELVVKDGKPVKRFDKLESK
jgi:hypothetical protein